MLIACPNCGFSKEVDSSKVPSGTTNATCPQCSKKFPLKIETSKQGSAKPDINKDLAPQPPSAASAAKPAAAEQSFFGPVKSRRLSAAGFFFAVLAFFLPFVTVSCQGQHLMTVTGIQLITGSQSAQQTPSISGGGGMGGEMNLMGDLGSAGMKTKQEPLVIAAFAAGVLGIIISIFKSRKTVLVAAVFGIAGAALLLAFKLKLDGDITKDTGGIVVQLQYRIGYVLALVFFAVAAVINGVVFAKKDTS